MTTHLQPGESALPILATPDAQRQALDSRQCGAAPQPAGPRAEVGFPPVEERFHSHNHPLKGLVLLVTEECNLRCDYCYIRKLPRHMPQQTADRAIDFLVANSQPAPAKLSICFFGGEPLLVPKLIEHVCHAAREKAGAAGREIAFSMTTNATLVDRRRAQLIRQFGIVTTLSLDGIGEAHDRHRKTVAGKGSFRLIERHLERLRDLPGLTVRLTVAPETAPLLPDSIRWLFDRGFRRIAYSPVVEAAWDSASLAALYDSYEALYDLQRESAGRGLISNLPKTEDRLSCVSDDPGFGCGAARNIVAVDTDGTLYPCHRYVGYFKNGRRQQLGNVADGFDTAAREYYIAANHIDTHRGCGSGLFEKDVPAAEHACRSCALSPVCATSCMAISERMTGDPQRPAPINRVLAQIQAAAHLAKRRPDAAAVTGGDDRQCGVA